MQLSCRCPKTEVRQSKIHGPSLFATADIAKDEIVFSLREMGPVDPLPTHAAKIFASCYALFSGLAFVGIVSVLLAPFVHRMLHRFHAEERE